MNSVTTYTCPMGKSFHFNDHVCVEMLIGVPDEKRTGRLVQVRKGASDFGSDLLFIRLRDGSLASFGNAMIRRADDKRFEEAFYIFNHRTPPLIPEQPPFPDDSIEREYTYCGEWPETGFVIDNPCQPATPIQSFSMTITNTQENEPTYR